MAKRKQITDPFICFKMVADLIQRADEMGYLITAERVAKKPLAMRNATTKVSMRAKVVR